MTNTINSVPRELLERVLYLMDNYIGTTHTEEDELRALLSVPSPAGVDGLEVRAYERKWSSDNIKPEKRVNENGRKEWPFKFKLIPVTQRPCLPDDEQLCRLSDAQAIIDGLRGENERIRLNIAEYNESIACYQSERDQQDQRIGELEWLLLDTGAERNAMQRERDAYKLLLDRECNDSDSIFMALGVAPDSIRTEGGFLMVAHLVSLIV